MMDADKKTEVSTVPLVTIAIPSYNRVKRLKTAIESALAQDYANFEVFVSDNCSTDGTDALLGGICDPRLRFVRQPRNVGLAGNWNACLREARGEFYLVLSDDDSLTPTAISDLMVPFLSSRQADSPPADSVAFCYGYCEVNDAVHNETVLSKSAPRWEQSEEYRNAYLRFERIVYPSATLLRTEDARNVGGYGDHIRCSSDVEMTFRVSSLRPVVACTQSVSTHYSFYDGNYTCGMSTKQVMEHAMGLSELAVELASRLRDRKAVHRSNVAGSWHASYTCAHSIYKNVVAGRVGLATAVAQIAAFRKAFYSRVGFVVLLKLVAKFVLFRVFNYRVEKQKAG